MGNRLSWAMVTTLLAGCASTGGVAPRSAIHTMTLEAAGTRGLRYAISTPREMLPDLPVPLVVALHPGGHGAPFYGRQYLEMLFEPALQGLGAIVVAPDCPDRGWATPASEAAVMGLVRHLQQSYPVDAERVVVTGYSMGGMGAWYLAARQAETFSAAIPISGTTDRAAELTAPAVPLYVIHSRLDEVLPLAPVRRAVKTLQSRGVSVELTVVNHLKHYETARFVRALKAAVPWLRGVWGSS